MNWLDLNHPWALKAALLDTDEGSVRPSCVYISQQFGISNRIIPGTYLLVGERYTLVSL